MLPVSFFGFRSSEVLGPVPCCITNGKGRGFLRASCDRNAECGVNLLCFTWYHPNFCNTLTSGVEGKAKVSAVFRSLRFELQIHSHQEYIPKTETQQRLLRNCNRF